MRVLRGILRSPRTDSGPSWRWATVWELLLDALMLRVTSGHGVPVGWLGTTPTLEHASHGTFGQAFGDSLGLHATILLLIVLLAGTVRPIELPVDPPLVVRIVPQLLPQPQTMGLRSGGGGGGGSPAPAPRRPVQIPRHKAPDPVPAASAAPKSDPVLLPVLDLPMQTDLASVLQASGSSVASIATYGGGGRGSGLGEGTGVGVGPGSGGGIGGGSGGGSGAGRGFGTGAVRPGGGISTPVLLRLVQPKYTGQAMRAKIQGIVELEAVVLPNGSIGDIRMVRSLDRLSGLDDEAIKAAREWLFAPGCDTTGRPLPVIVTLILEFRIH
jgi:periplasmic protein TonB